MESVVEQSVSAIYTSMIRTTVTARKELENSGDEDFKLQLVLFIQKLEQGTPFVVFSTNRSNQYGGGITAPRQV